MVRFAENFDYNSLGYVPTMAEFLNNFERSRYDVLVCGTSAGVTYDNQEFADRFIDGEVLPRRFMETVGYMMDNGFVPLHVEYNGGEIKEPEWELGTDFAVLFRFAVESQELLSLDASTTWELPRWNFEHQQRIIRFASQLHDKNIFPVLYLLWR